MLTARTLGGSGSRHSNRLAARSQPTLMAVSFAWLA